MIIKLIGGAVFHYDPTDGAPVYMKSRGPTAEEITVLGLTREPNTHISFKYEYTDKKHVSRPQQTITNVINNEPSSNWQTLLYQHMVAMKGFVNPGRSKNNIGSDVTAISIPKKHSSYTRTRHTNKNDRNNVNVDSNSPNFNQSTAYNSKRKTRILRERTVPKFVSETGAYVRTSTVTSDSKPTIAGYVRGRKASNHPHSDQLGNLAIGINVRRSRYPEADERQKPDRIRISNRQGYHWQQNKITPCSATCTVGTQVSFFSCFHRNGVKVNDSMCDEDSHPDPKYHVCGRNRCQPRWVTGLWSQCSRTCGGGEQVRSVRCWQMLAPGFDSTVHEYRCERASKPMSSRSCSDVACGPQWEVTEWEECSSACGYGEQMRRVKCSTGINNMCDVTRKPLVRRQCKQRMCTGYWNTESWSSCTGSCGQGVRRRRVECKDSVGRPLNEKYCDTDTKPLSTVACGTSLYCPPSWVPQPWGECILSCGQGVLSRTVVCGSVITGKFRIQSDNNCKRLPEPKTAASCMTRKCDPEWYFTEWSECSETCGTTAVRTRSVRCYHDNQPSENCQESQKPASEENCRLPPCRQSTTNTDDRCADNLQNCHLLVNSLCQQPYYMSQCCATCRQKKLHSSP